MQDDQLVQKQIFKAPKVFLLCRLVLMYSDVSNVYGYTCQTWMSQQVVFAIHGFCAGVAALAARPWRAWLAGNSFK